MTSPHLPDVRRIGFDLDQTLYPKSPEIDAVIQRYIHHVIATRKGISVVQAKSLFDDHYPAVSGRKALLALGFSDAAEIVQEALERADITPFLKRDAKVLRLLTDLRQRFGPLALITGSPKGVVEKKLNALGIKGSLFSCIITGEVSKSDGSAYRRWLESERDRDESLRFNHLLYIGDRASTDAEVPLSLGMRAILVRVPERDPRIAVPQLEDLDSLRGLLLSDE